MVKELLPVGVAGGLAIVLSVPAAAGAKSPCTFHTVSYLAQGKYVSSTPDLTPSKSWSGTLTIKLHSANHQFKKANNLTVKRSASGTDYTYTISGARSHFGTRVKSPATTADHVSVTRAAESAGDFCQPGYWWPSNDNFYDQDSCTSSGHNFQFEAFANGAEVKLSLHHGAGNGDEQEAHLVTEGLDRLFGVPITRSS
jgi:hypothetical protein